MRKRSHCSRRSRKMGLWARSLGLTLGLAVAFAACGGDSPMDPGPAQPTVLTQDFTDIVVTTAENGIFFFFEYEIFVAANVSVSVSWTPVEADIDMALTPGRCFTDGCDLATSVAFAATLANPETLSFNVTPGDYTTVIENVGPGLASGTITVTITPT